jgi:UDP-N-acetylmuramoylalanine--D-glutamate ligase
MQGNVPITDFHGKRVTVMGLGHFGGGTAVSRWLVGQGAQVLVTDHAPAEKLSDPISQLKDLPITFHLGPNQQQDDFTGADIVVASPAIPPSNPFLQAARAAGVPVTSEICLFVQRCPSRIFGVTGTKGKSTTSTLLGKMVETQTKTWVGGNIGKSLLADLPNISGDDLVVLELSSFMLDHLASLRWSPSVAVVTMISVDHLDWHGSIDKYVDAKRNIVRFQTAADFAVLNRSNEVAWSFAKDTSAKIVPFGIANSRPFQLQLPGEHNQLNAQAAFAAASTAGVSWEAAQSAIADFRGLSHRLQVIGERHGVRFVNDSIATIPEAAIAALNSFPAGKVIQIVGGSDKKHLPIDEMCVALAARAKAVLCIGETGARICQMLGSIKSSDALVVRDCGDLHTAIAAAQELAAPGDIVLLSPGHPSYDQFVNFEHRGSVFTLAFLGG